MQTPCACTAIRKASRAVFRYYEEKLSGAEITVTQYSILRALERNGPTALSRLAEELVMERTTLYRTIRPLVDKKYIVLREGDNRKTKVASVTKSGLKLIQRVKPAWQIAQDNVVAALGEDKWKKLSEELLQIPELLAELK